ncbi:MAG TPA: DinB family protein [Candidatus Angelobacter sp.]|nr:DinB family protein [Candidatus Angelobacter sp.]
MASDNSLAGAYLQEAQRNFRSYKKLAERAFEQLRDEDFFYVPDPESNSIATIVKHMAGNMRSRWTDFLTSDGEKPNRNRDQEFEMSSATTRADVLRWWEEGWNTVFQTLESLKPEDVSRTVHIRGEAHSVLQAINRQVAHYSHHIGQILYLGKHIRKAEWKSLSVPKGKSAEYNALKPEDRKTEFSPPPRV